jgi:hypothetical protein
MPKINPFQIAVPFALTIGAGYTACAFAFWLWPDAAVNFMNALFHGFDFRKLKVDPAIFNFGSFLYALGVIIAWAFGLGAIFGWLFNRFYTRS